MNPQITPATVAAGLDSGSRAGMHARDTEATGPIDAIEQAMAGLSGLDSASTRSHVGAFERVHQALTDALAAIDGV